MYQRSTAPDIKKNKNNDVGQNYSYITFNSYIINCNRNYSVMFKVWYR